MVTPEEFLSELERELLKVTDPLDRHKVVLGYAAHMQARERSIAVEAVRDFNPLQTDHSKCIDPHTCIGYQNAQSDFDNERDLYIAELEGEQKPYTVERDPNGEVILVTGNLQQAVNDGVMEPTGGLKKEQTNAI